MLRGYFLLNPPNGQTVLVLPLAFAKSVDRFGMDLSLRPPVTHGNGQLANLVLTAMKHVLAR